MELRLFSDALLRSRMSSLFSFLAPSIPPPWRLATTSRPARLSMPRSMRCTSSKFHAIAWQRANSSSTAADLENKPRPKPNQSFRPPPQQRRPTDDGIIQSQLDNLLNSTLPTPNLARGSPKPADESSATMMETTFQKSFRTRDPNEHYKEIARKMQFPPQESSSAGTLNPMFRDAYRKLEAVQRTTKRASRTVRSRPAVGRAIEVIPERGVDVARALRILNISCNHNRVKQDLSRQRFHERPGLKRKRLKSERWRKMFKQSFKATVMRVREMRRKGW